MPLIFLIVEVFSQSKSPEGFKIKIFSILEELSDK